MLSLTNKFVFIFFLLILLPLISLSQNRQNKYYNPFRLSISGVGKFPTKETNLYNFSYGTGISTELIYTIDNNAQFEASIEAGYFQSFSKGSSYINRNGQFGINIYYYLYDDFFSPFIGLGYDLESFIYKKKYITKPFIGLSTNNFSFILKYGVSKKFNSLEIGIKYFFKERPCGCFPHNK